MRVGRRKDEYQSHVVIYITFVPPPQRQKGGTAKKKTLLSWYEERVTQHYLLSPKLMALDNGQYRSSRANTQPMFLFFCLAFISCCFSCYLSFSLIFLLIFFLFSFLCSSRNKTFSFPWLAENWIFPSVIAIPRKRTLHFVYTGTPSICTVQYCALAKQIAF